MKVNVMAVALTSGILLGAYIMGFTLISISFDGYGADFLNMWVPLHPGYSISLVGALVGFAYGFVEGFIWLYIGGLLYNMLAMYISED